MRYLELTLEEPAANLALDDSDDDENPCDLDVETAIAMANNIEFYRK